MGVYYSKGEHAFEYQQLKKWTKKENCVVIGDSDADGSLLEGGYMETIRFKSNVCVIVFDNRNSIFGGYYQVPISEENTYTTDNDAFVFSFITPRGSSIPLRHRIFYSKKDRATYYSTTEGNKYFSFGNSDLTIYPNKSGSSYLSTYQRTTCSSLSGEATFKITRLILAQMFNDEAEII
ncbi:hypothetical protein EIN_408900 [Entamoeba invadens IP1]|uniref:TLDc domain-containing protein n=1 Tax=Entamoeba invadens IP1 TaxID=370355 RepID=A0A0A1TWQ5_ENTIV|nr:hypothetical protein EIN_408900 [Entamoeba invadens IP1]ELP85611.1 hypothetical protein EIN_408900 [Entamoeba invadens IP1]|eukprot:XP_004184957.1 hypothetical protein EIN_408900 [Entamoeba invadens IP1]